MADIISQCASLVEQEFGPDYLGGREEFVSNYVDPSGWRLYVHEQTEPADAGPGDVIHCVTDSEELPVVDVAGFFVVGTVDEAELEERTTIEDVRSHLPYGDDAFPVTLLKTKVVRPEWEGRGVGWRLGVASLEHYGGPYVGVLLDRANDDRKGHIQNLRKVGGREIHRVERANPQGYRCVSCGIDDECACDHLLYVVDGGVAPDEQRSTTAEPRSAATSD